MRRKYIIWILLLTLIILSACQFRETSTVRETPAVREAPAEKPSDAALSWQEDIEQVRKLYGSQSIPQHLLNEDAVLQGDEFDVGTAMEILDHLSMADGYQLAYVYKYDPMGSYPVLYAHLEDSPPFTSLKEYTSAHPECFQSSEKPSHCSYQQLIETDGSEIGYLQFVLLNEMGRQFYLDWHANYNDTTLIATEKALDQIQNKVLSNIHYAFYHTYATDSYDRLCHEQSPYYLVHSHIRHKSFSILWFLFLSNPNSFYFF